MRSATGVWGSRTTFLLALAASAIGMGNLWRFSYLLGENGGALFLLVYLACLLLVAVPILIAEIVIGSQGRASPVTALIRTSERSEAPRAWVGLGWLAMVTAVLVLTCYCVVAGWGLAYVQKLASGVFAEASAPDVGAEFQSLLGDPWPLVQWQSLFILLVFSVSALGIHRGLGLLFWLAGPLLLVGLGVLIGYSLEYGDTQRAGEFLFSVNWYDFTPGAVLIAMAQAFYTLGIGAGIGMAFGAYAPDKLPIGRTVVAVALIDATVAVAAGVAIFPLIFANNINPAMGPGLIFVGLPHAFGNMVQGEFYGAVFFLSLVVVAFGSAVALAEPGVSYLAERLRRPLAAVVGALLIWSMALLCALSLNVGEAVRLYRGYTLFELLDLITVTVLLPLVALLTALYVGYALHREILRVELYRESRHFFSLWRSALRYIAPPAILVITLAVLMETG